jgi:hypothetical protein
MYTYEDEDDDDDDIFNLSSFTLSEANYRLTTWLSRYSLFLFYLQLHIFYCTKPFISNYV